MKTEKTFHCVEMKAEIQELLLREVAERPLSRRRPSAIPDADGRRWLSFAPRNQGKAVRRATKIYSAYADERSAIVRR
jgi:hypothetical protein